MIRRLVNRFFDAQTWADEVGETTQKVIRAIYRPAAVRDLLHGVWLGHPLHPLLSDVPVGAFTAGLVLDLLTGAYPGLHDGANLVTLIGFVVMAAAILSGFADYVDLEGRARRYGTVHAFLMIMSAAFYLFSLLVRYGFTPGTVYHSTLTAVLGYVLLTVGAYLGGELAFGFGAQVTRHAWRGGGDKWLALDVTDVPEGALTKAKAGTQTLVLVRSGGQLFAMHDVCAHQGCSLAAGTIVGDEIQCPCHGSRYRIRDGAVATGPSVFDQPAYEVRTAQGRLEVRRVGPR
ncbi:MAG: Rieske 2Fe-2S domain-containing protein [Chloroflexota bacterium]|nr:Rieske 2Fe-2S domain-containing protein [Chloroflexota bacterium]